MENVILIPAYNPDDKLIRLIDELIFLKIPIVVVNDGSDKCFNYIFEIIKSKSRVKVINHEINWGKGAALKTGIKYIMENYKECTGIVTADADGQHLPKDIIKMGDCINKNPNSLILGVRDFNKENIPLKSRLGNKITSLIFLLVAHKNCRDTQTGLRGIPKYLFNKCLSIEGDRYEYEMNMLMKMARDNIEFIYEEITTVYIENNKSSHFNPISDSIKIYFNILKFSLSSLLSSALDIGVFTGLIYILHMSLGYEILVATILARIISGTFNFVVNKLWVFSSESKTRDESVKYIVLFISIMLCSYLGVILLSFLAIPIILIKIIVDGSLFILSYQIQSRFIFSNGRN